MKKLTLEESKKRMLLVLDEIDKFCKAHDIKYMLSYGTLLGAIRHKGFIPWDDDLDVMMLWDDYERFCNEYKDTKDFKLCTAENEKYYDYPYARLEDKHTVSRIYGRNTGGINVDIYPVHNFSQAYLDTHLKKMHKIISRRKRLGGLIRLSDRMGMRFMGNIFAQIRQNLGKKHKKVIERAASEKSTGQVVPYLESVPIDVSALTSQVPVEFEGKSYMAPSNWDLFLTTYYGDYMQLPPESQRHPYHAGNYYLTD